MGGAPGPSRGVWQRAGEAAARAQNSRRPMCVCMYAYAVCGGERAQGGSSLGLLWASGVTTGQPWALGSTRVAGAPFVPPRPFQKVTPLLALARVTPLLALARVTPLLALALAIIRPWFRDTHTVATRWPRVTVARLAPCGSEGPLEAGCTRNLEKNRRSGRTTNLK
jgi:hypothetical protein